MRTGCAVIDWLLAMPQPHSRAACIERDHSTTRSPFKGLNSRFQALSWAAAYEPLPGAGLKCSANLSGTRSHSSRSAGGSPFTVMFGQTLA